MLVGGGGFEHSGLTRVRRASLSHHLQILILLRFARLNGCTLSLSYPPMSPLYNEMIHVV